MAQLEDLVPGTRVVGLLPGGAVTIVAALPRGGDAVEVVYRDAGGRLGQELVFRSLVDALQIADAELPWRFDADGAQFRLAAEARRIQLAYLFDPHLAVHTSRIDPLPHQITAVYEAMLDRQPLRYVLADDPGAGKTIMTGLLIKELLLRGDLRRCLVVAPGSLVEQWQDELAQKFDLPFEILTNDRLEAARSGNAFGEMPLLIARLDKLARDLDTQAKLLATEWDLIVVDEAHKLAASFYGNEIKYTKRYQLGQALGTITRHFLLLTATPHNGKEADFQLFMALIDPDRFAGRFRDKVDHVDTSDLMRRLLKEHLLTFAGKPLFPERRSTTIDYTLTPEENALYNAVTDYVRQEFNRAEALANDGRKGTIGFALTILQRRLASSPAAIWQSLKRRRERLERRLREEQALAAADEAVLAEDSALPIFSAEDLEDLDEQDPDIEQTETTVVDRATAARTVAELRTEIAVLTRLEEQALLLRRAGTDKKWEELSRLLQSPEMFDADARRRKLVIFTEHRDTLDYLAERIGMLLGQPAAVVQIHGGLRRDERRRAQAAFTQDPTVAVLLATDAAGEGINLQRAHLMVNYDLPWNPNRLEQRFGRIHRIGQTEVCHLWNLVAGETREGEVYFRLLRKLEDARDALGGKVFDILSKLTFQDVPLRDLLVEAIRYGNDPAVRARLHTVVEGALDTAHLEALLADRALATDILGQERVREVREVMERAAARRLQPHFIADFCLEALRAFGGTVRERESHRYEITHVPAAFRRADLTSGREPILPRYERVTFESDLATLPGKPLAALICPGHPLLDAAIALVLERYGATLTTGAPLVDPADPGTTPRVLCLLEHAIQDSRQDGAGNRHIISRQLQFIEQDAAGATRIALAAPYLDYAPLAPEDLPRLAPILTAAWPGQAAAAEALDYAVAQLVPAHLADVRARRLDRIERTLRAVHDRLTREIAYWDRRASELKDQELRGRPNAHLNSGKARQTADALEHRLKQRTEELENEKAIAALPPVVVGGALIIPQGLLDQLRGAPEPDDAAAHETARIEAIAMAAVTARERALGFDPRDVSAAKIGYDIESRDPVTGALRFIEVKGRAWGAETVTVSKNEILTGLNQPENFFLAIVLVDEVARELAYVRRPFRQEPDFATTSVTFNIQKLLATAEMDIR